MAKRWLSEIDENGARVRKVVDVPPDEVFTAPAPTEANVVAEEERRILEVASLSDQMDCLGKGVRLLQVAQARDWTPEETKQWNDMLVMQNKIDRIRSKSREIRSRGTIAKDYGDNKHW